MGNCKVTGIHCSFLALYNDCVKGHSGRRRVGLGAIAREVREEAAGERDKTIRVESRARAAQKIPLSFPEDLIPERLAHSAMCLGLLLPNR